MKLELEPLPAFRDNYIWLLLGSAAAAVVDPGESAPVHRTLERLRLPLAAILITHHHSDHMGGAEELKQRYQCPVFGPATEAIPAVNRPLRERQYAEIPALGTRFRVLEIPGHTAGHIAFYGHNIVFCGDTLFSAGCGRLFEGSPADMSRSLGKLAALPDSTAVCCGHEYTAANLRFAAAVEPVNREISDYARQVAKKRGWNLPSLPSTLAQERQVNPFLRCTQGAVITAAERHAGHPLHGPIEVFATIRSWKDHFE